MVELTARTDLGRPLLRPTQELADAIHGVLGRALQLYPVLLHIFVFLSNHRHLLATVPNADVYAAFVCYLNKQTAKIVRDLVGWKGQVWGRTSPPIPILDDDSAQRRFHYILSNGVKEGLVASPLEWPGPSAARALAGSGRIHASWRGHGKSTPMPVTIELAPLPSWSGLSQAVRANRVHGICEEISAAARRERLGKPPLGVEGLLAMDVTKPIELETTAPPTAIASDPEVRKSFEQRRAAFIDQYRRASTAFLAGDRIAEFPPGAILPPRAFRDG